MPDCITYDYDVAVSFAGEDRAYVEDVVRRLQENGIKVFYDEDNLSEMWGHNLVDFLQAVYSRRARYAVLFISRHYVEKKWPNHERQSAQDRALQESSPYILPIRLDDAQLPGLHSTVSYLNAKTVGIDGVVEAVKKKVGSVSGPTRPKFDGKVPRTSEAVATLLSERPAAWEHLLYAGILRQGIDGLEGKYNDHLIEYAKHNGRILDDNEALHLTRSAFTSVAAIAGSIERVLSAEAQTAAFGKSGQPGDPDRIIHLAHRFISVYEEFLDWSANLRATGISNERLGRAFALQARMSDMPIRKMREFVDGFVAEADEFSDRLASGEEIELEWKVEITVDDSLVKEYQKLLKRFK